MGYMQSIHFSDMFQGNCSKFWEFAALAAPSWLLKILIMALLSYQLSSMVLGNSDMLKPPHTSWWVLERWLRGAGVTLKRYAMSKGKEKPQQVGRWSKMAFKIKPHTRQRCSEGSNKSCVHQDPETPTETETELCLSVSYGGMGQHGLPQGQGLWLL